jgi:hypothetical protein
MNARHKVTLLTLCGLLLSCREDSVRDRQSALSANALSGDAGATCIPLDTVDSLPDGVDEDCDGEVDEDVDFRPSSCPAGSNVIEGTRGNDVLNGTSGADCILGYGGDDTLSGGAGNDFIAGGPGNDSINTGSGQDVVYGGADDDSVDARSSALSILHGGPGNDTMSGGNIDTEYGDDGDDILHGGKGRATVYGGNGDDTITGGNQLTYLYGEDGNDTIIAGSGPTGLYGGRGNDTLTAGTNRSTLRGGDGNDTLTGGTNVDALYGDACHDLILPSNGGDTVLGGTGVDACPTDATECELSSTAAGSCSVDADCAAQELCAVAVHFCVPASAAASNDDTCDGVDDDCDGDVDEDFHAHATSCGVGACAGTGTASCTNYVFQDTCQAGSPPSSTDATCDGIDDNCNGASDEDYAGHATSCGVGACVATGATSCVAGQVANSCVAGTPAVSDATCDGVDDDCNGIADDGYAAHATSCGVGACAAIGVALCVGGVVVDTCSTGAPAASDATCDGVDDDCNGGVDDGYVSFATSCGVGACAASGATSCVSGVVVDSCSAGAPAASDATCDGVDDDCDGSVDDDFAATCSGTVLRTCNAGQVSNTDCSDHDVCTGTDTCSPSGCVHGAPLIVDDGDPCTQDVCDPVNGPAHSLLPAGTSCSDGNVCNGDEVCRGPCVAPVSTMTAWWTGDGNANDPVGGFNGVVQGTVSYTPGLVAQAFQFHGSATERVRVASQPALDLSTLPAATFSGFFRTTTDNLVIAKHQCGFVNGWFFYSGYGCYFNGQIGIPGSGVNTLDGQYHHFACVKDGTNYYEYIDGVLRQSGTSSVVAGNAVDVQLGGLTGGSCTNTSPFNGDIDEIQLYGRALSAAEIASLSQSRGSGGTCKSAQTCLPGTPVDNCGP